MSQTLIAVDPDTGDRLIVDDICDTEDYVFIRQNAGQEDCHSLAECFHLKCKWHKNRPHEVKRLGVFVRKTLYVCLRREQRHIARELASLKEEWISH